MKTAALLLLAALAGAAIGHWWPAIARRLETAPCGAYVAVRDLPNVSGLDQDQAPDETTRYADCRRRAGHSGNHRGPVEEAGRMTGGVMVWRRS